MTRFRRYDPLALRPGPGSLGWGVAGASSVAREAMVGAIRRQPPAPGTTQVASSWVFGVFSHSAYRARVFADATQIPHAFSELDAFLDRSEIHCVYVGSYPRLHPELVIAALEAGKHVLCEAPMALSITDAQAMARLAEERNLVLGVNYVGRGDPALVAMKALIQEGTIGDVVGGRVSNTSTLPPRLLNWRLEYGVVLDRSHQDVDVVRWLQEDEVAQVSALAGDPLLGGPREDNVTASLRMARGGLLFQLHDAFAVPHQVNSVRVYGTSGTLIARHALTRAQESELLLVRNDRVQVLPIPAADPFQRAVQAFNEAVRARIPGVGPSGEDPRPQPLATAQDGIRNLQVALAIKKSAQTGWSVPLEGA